MERQRQAGDRAEESWGVGGVEQAAHIGFSPLLKVRIFLLALFSALLSSVGPKMDGFISVPLV